jgi:hypothetical protein
MLPVDDGGGQIWAKQNRTLSRQRLAPKPTTKLLGRVGEFAHFSMNMLFFYSSKIIERQNLLIQK